MGSIGSCVNSYGTFAICRPLFSNLWWDAPVVKDYDLDHAFDHVPGTQNPGKLSGERFHRLLACLGVRVVCFPEGKSRARSTGS